MWPLWKIVWQSLEKLDTELPHNPAISLLGMHSREMKTRTRANIGTWVFTVVLL